MRIRTLSVLLAFVLIAALSAGVTFTNLDGGGVETSNESTESTETPTETPSGERDEYMNPDFEGYSEEKYGEKAFRYEVMGPDPDDPGTSYIAANNTSTFELNGPVRDNVSFNTSSAEVESWIVYYINQERQSRGLEPVTPNETIASYARAHSYYLARHDEGGHVDYNDRRPCRLTNIRGTEVQVFMRLQNDDWKDEWGATWGHEATSEQELAQRIVIAWLESAPHRAAILAENPNLNVGAGVYFDKAPNGDGPSHKDEENAYKDYLEPGDTVAQATVDICLPNGDLMMNHDAPLGEPENAEWAN